MRRYLLQFETFAVGAIGLFSGLFFLQTYEYGRRAALFPRIISGAVFFLTVLFILSRIRRIVKQAGTSLRAQTLPTKTPTEAAVVQGINWVLTLGAAAGYFILIYLIGFGPSTFLYVATHLYLAGYRRHSVIFSFALAMAIIIVVTGYLFAIPLPEGVLGKLIIGER